MAPTALFVESVTRLHEAIDGLAQEDLELVPASCLGDDLRGLRSTIERMEAEFSRRLERFDRHQGYVPSGYCGAANWLNDECRMTRSTAWERARRSEPLVPVAPLPMEVMTYLPAVVGVAVVGKYQTAPAVRMTGRSVTSTSRRRSGWASSTPARPHLLRPGTSQSRGGDHRLAERS